MRSLLIRCDAPELMTDGTEAEAPDSALEFLTS